MCGVLGSLTLIAGFLMVIVGLVTINAAHTPDTGNRGMVVTILGAILLALLLIVRMSF